MRTIVVSGEKSGVGKTYVARQLLISLPGWSALKVTVSKEDGCPHHRSCGICGGVKRPFYIVKDPKVINQTGKDTALLKKAGAKEVLWLKAKAGGLKQGLFKAFSAFSECEGIVIEGTSVLKFFKPDLNIHVYSQGKYGINTRRLTPRSKG